MCMPFKGAVSNCREVISRIIEDIEKAHHTIKDFSCKHTVVYFG